MSFALPGFLWFLLLVPVVILLHFVRRERKRIEVSSTLLWDQLKRELRHRLFIHRLLKDLLLLLQIAAVILLTLGLARPSIAIAGNAPREDLALLFDISAGMAAESNGTSRLDRAKQLAIDLLENTSRRSTVRLFTAWRRTEFLESALIEPESAVELIDSISHTGAEGDLRSSISQVLTAVGTEIDRLVVFTDLAFESPDIEYPSIVEIMPVAESDVVENAGITAFAFRRPVHERFAYELLLEIESYLSTGRQATAIIEVDGREIHREELTLDSGVRETLVVPYDGLTPREAEAKLEFDDAVKADNRAVVVLNPSGVIDVKLITPGNAFLETALDLYPGLTVEIIEPEAINSGDIVMFDRVTPPPLPEGRYLYIATTPVDLAADIPFVPAPAITGWNPDHPILTGIDPASITLFTSLAVARDEAIESVIDAGVISLLWTRESGDSREVGIGFDITASDLPLRTDFPLLVANLISWLEPETLESGTTDMGCGDFIEGDGAIDDWISILRPDGSVEEVHATGGRYSYGQTDLPGIYRLTKVEQPRSVAVNLTSREETNIVPRGEIRAAHRAATEASLEHSRVGREMWRLLVLIVVAMFIVEWLARKRRGAA